MLEKQKVWIIDGLVDYGKWHYSILKLAQNKQQKVVTLNLIRNKMN